MGKLCLLSALSLLAFVADARPADYYMWHSKIEPVEVCAQTSLGDGWVKTTGPYRDAQCLKLKDRVK